MSKKKKTNEDEVVEDGYKELKTKAPKLKLRRQTEEYVKIVTDFLEAKNGGVLEPTWQLSIDILKSYYYMFLQLNYEIEELPSLFLYDNKRKQYTPNPILLVRDRCVTQLTQLQRELGLTIKAASKLNLVEPKKEKSILEQYMETSMGLDDQE